ncbi:long-chain fatty acid transport protein 4 [Galendromus occidentalis]|uniref:long-chain-fatty-acid--CoA ligase n=1 Tax=Galendromus occidentalis TaxID=34638 RepID=A0AAJ6QYD3_9ACAR|nr:long-chain fatty acid transport protein 4 [Galendromus occidentalis]
MWKTLHLVARTSARDIAAFWKFGKYVTFIRYVNFRQKTVPMWFREKASKVPQKTMFIYGDRKWSFSEAEQFTNKIANYFSSRGLKAGDDVALMMENRPESVLIWLGLSKIGVASALINTNLRGDPLLHCAKMVNSKAVIFSPEMASQIAEISSSLEGTLNSKLYRFGSPQHQERGDKMVGYDVSPDIMGCSSEHPEFHGKLSDCLLYVYTSGTTGLPKAARLRQSRFFLTSGASRFLADWRDDDVSYCYLPLYHFAGGVMQMSQTVLFGLTAVIVPGFSATNFWKDCIKHDCTVTQYIGEVCRYLYLQPGKPEDRQHKIRNMVGNGMRKEMWIPFQQRFGVKYIREIYGATESNGNSMNLDGTPGSVGIYPTICRLSTRVANLFYHRFIIKVHPETGEPLRGPDGLCILVGPNEPGEFVAEITRKPEGQFDGYTDTESTEKKIYRDVVRKGDRCFASGDILLYDDDGHLFFKDRTGDTYRWKGENVSTAEVEGVVSKYANHFDCVVIGVEIPNCEGKAGMATIIDQDQGVDLQELLKKISNELPSYALPLFIRLTKHIETTGTYKLQKTKLVKEGYDIKSVSDPIFFLDMKSMKYVRLTPELYEKIQSGQVRL